VGKISSTRALVSASWSVNTASRLSPSDAAPHRHHPRAEGFQCRRWNPVGTAWRRLYAKLPVFCKLTSTTASVVRCIFIRAREKQQMQSSKYHGSHRTVHARTDLQGIGGCASAHGSHPLPDTSTVCHTPLEVQNSGPLRGCTKCLCLNRPIAIRRRILIEPINRDPKIFGHPPLIDHFGTSRPWVYSRERGNGTDAVIGEPDGGAGGRDRRRTCRCRRIRRRTMAYVLTS